MFDFNFLRKSVADLAQQTRELRGEIQALKQQREQIASASVHRSDLKACLDQVCQVRAAEYRASMAAHLKGMGNDCHSLQGHVDHGYLRLSAPLPGVAGVTPGMVEGMLCALLGDQLKLALFRVIDELDWPDEGLPMIERADALKKLDSQIDKLIEKEQGLVKSAREAGISIH